MNENNFCIPNQYKEIISVIIANELKESLFDLLKMIPTKKS